MTEPEQYEDPALARRFRSWTREAAPPAAPERLVSAVMDAVMDDVERAGARSRVLRRAPIRLLAGTVQYAVLTAVIVIGVAGGILVSRNLSSSGDGGLSQPTPTQTPSPSPSSDPTSSPLGSLPEVDRIAVDGRAVVADGAAVWVATDAGTLLELGARAEERTETDLGTVGSSLAMAEGAVWVASPEHDLLRVDATSRQIATVPDSAGERVIAGGGSVWVRQPERVLRIDPATLSVTATFSVPGSRTALGMTVVGEELWVGTNTAIQRFDIPAGNDLGSIQGDAVELAFQAGAVWATRGTELLRIDPETLDIQYLAGLPGPVGMAGDGDRLWVAGPPVAGRGDLVEIDTQAGQLVSRTAFPASALGVAAAGRSAWVLTDEDRSLRRYDSASR